MPSQKFVALDTRFILALERGEESCQGVIDFFSRMGWFCLVTETVREELADLEFDDDNPEIKRLAGNALRRLGIYNILAPDLKDVDLVIARIIAQRLLETNLITGGTQNDALAVTEAASHGCFFLVTDREHLANCNADAVRVALAAQDLTGCTIVSMNVMLVVMSELKVFVEKKNKQPPS